MATPDRYHRSETAYMYAKAEGGGPEPELPRGRDNDIITSFYGNVCLPYMGSSMNTVSSLLYCVV